MQQAEYSDKKHEINMNSYYTIDTYLTIYIPVMVSK